MKSLSPAELVQAQLMIDRASMGVHELKEIYGTAWSRISVPTAFGAKFKRAVVAGDLRRIRLHSRKTNNHHIYEVLG